MPESREGSPEPGRSAAGRDPDETFSVGVRRPEAPPPREDGDGTVSVAGHGPQDRGDDATRATHAVSVPASGLTETAPSSLSSTDTDPAALPAVDDRCYDIAGELARGGLGRILQARDRRLDRPVALKQALDSAPVDLARFVREALITARLQHPAIVPVYEAGRFASGEPFYAMKLVSGRSFKEVIQSTARLEERLALLPHVLAVADAMAYAHSHRIIHRDLKPSNVLVGPFGETVVIDWGLAKDLRAPSVEAGASAADAVVSDLLEVPDQLTTAGLIIGTPQYMPPEQARGEPVDERADVYALGAMLYYTLTGAMPYEGESAGSVLARLLAAPPPPLETRQPDVPQDLAAIVRKAMAREPSDRYPSSRELAEDLRRFQTGQLVGARHYSRLALAKRWFARHRTAASLTTAFLAALATTGAISVRRVVRERNAAETSRNQLILTQAHLLLGSDPTGALALLKTYPGRGNEWEHAGTVAADAVSRGVARHVLRGHEYTVDRVAFSPDGQTVATGGGDGTVRLWEVRSGRGLQVLPSTVDVSVLVFSPDGRHLVAVGAEGGEVQRWELPGGRRQDLRGHREVVTAAVFAPDGRTLATGDRSGSIRLWSLGGAPQDRRSDVLSGHTGAVTGLAFLPGGAELASVATDGTVRLWRPETGVGRVLDREAAALTRLELSRDGAWLATAGEDGGVRLYEPVSGKVRLLGRHEETVRALAFSPDGRWLASAGKDREVRLWPLPEGRVRVLRGHEGEVNWVGFSPGGWPLASASLDGTVRLWSAEGVVRVLRGHVGEVNRAAFSPDGRWLVSGGDDRSARLWELPEAEMRALRGHRESVLKVAVGPGGQLVASAGADGTVRVWERATGTGRVLGAHEALVQGLDFAPDGSALGSASWDKTVRVWELDSRSHASMGQDAGEAHGERRPEGVSGSMRVNGALGAGTVRVLAHPAAQQRVRFLRGGAELATAGTDGVVRLWGRQSGAPRELGRHEGGGIYLLAPSPDGARLASAGGDGTVRVWTLATGAVEVLRGHKGDVYRVAFAPDGRRLASGGRDGSVRLWRLGSATSEVLGGGHGSVEALVFAAGGRELAAAFEDGIILRWELATHATHVLTGHEARARDLVGSPDGRLLASAGYDWTVRLWELDSGRVGILRGHEGHVLSVAFTPDGREVVSAGADATVRLWPVLREELVPRGRESLLRWLERVTTMRLGAEAMRR